jgi:hypothetical protein
MGFMESALPTLTSTPAKRCAAGGVADEPPFEPAARTRPVRAGVGRASGSGRAGGDSANGERVGALAAELREAYLDELECKGKAHPPTATVSRQANCNRNPNCFVYPKCRALWAKVICCCHSLLWRPAPTSSHARARWAELTQGSAPANRDARV